MGAHPAHTLGTGVPLLWRYCRPVFESRRLVFRYPKVAEVASILDDLCSLEVQRLISPQIIVPTNPADVLGRFETRHQAPFTGARSSYELGIFEKDRPGEVIGLAGLYHLDFGNAIAEIGVSILPHLARQRGLGTEAHERWIDFAFRDVGLFRVTGTVKATNEPALAVAAKIGMKREGLLRSHRYVAGERIDVVVLGILRDEWVEAQ